MTLILLSMLACETETPFVFEGGMFQMTTEAVADDCYDEAMNLVFMPEGTPNDFANTTELPGVDDLPSTYTITLQDPFKDMEVTVEAGETEDQMVITGAQQKEVDLNPDLWEKCVADLSIDVDVTILDEDSVEAVATLKTEALEGADCPELKDPCLITLDLSGVRAE